MPKKQQQNNQPKKGGKSSNKKNDDDDFDAVLKQGAAAFEEKAKAQKQQEAKKKEQAVAILGKKYRRKGLMHVTLISGFLGSGKTTLLTGILKKKDPEYKCAVIVNEISEFNIDANAVLGSSVIQSDEKVVEMNNGCVCCTLREDLLEQLSELHQKGFEAAIIEASGISEPMQTAQTFFFPHESKYLPPHYDPKRPDSVKDAMMNYAPLDNTVTVVDATRLIEHMGSLANAKSGDDRDIAKLMFEQLEFANVVLLNKIDLIPKANALAAQKKASDNEVVESDESKKNKEEGTATSDKEEGEDNQAATVEKLIGIIKSINSSCQVIPTVHSDVPMSMIIKTKNFTEEFLQNVQCSWTEGLDDMIRDGLSSVQPETEEYGVSSMAFVAHLPFHPKRLWDWVQKYFILHEEEAKACGQQQEEDPKLTKLLKQTPKQEEEERQRWAALVKLTGEARAARYGNIFRGKGFVWLANPARLDIAAQWAQAGSTVNFSAACNWDEFPSTNTFNPVEPSQRLIFIGQDLKKDVLEEDLLDLLLTEEEHAQMVEAAKKHAEERQAMMKRGGQPGMMMIPPDIFEDPFKSFFPDPVA